MAVVDTNVISYIFRDDTRAAAYDALLDGFEARAISFQTKAELEFWTLKHQWGGARRERLRRYLMNYTVFHSDDETCALWAQIRRQCEIDGAPIQAADAWIAAVALALDCPVVTHNAAHFVGIAGLDVRTIASGTAER